MIWISIDGIACVARRSRKAAAQMREARVLEKIYGTE